MTEMPPTFNWLPPLKLNFDRQTTIVQISQSKPHESINYPLLGPSTIAMSFEADVNFVSNATDSYCCGLAIKRCFNGPNLDCINKNISRNFPNFGNDIAWVEQHYDDCGSRSDKLSDANEVFDRIQEFVTAASRKEYNVGANARSFELKIIQANLIPDEELMLWHSWLVAMAESDPGFEKRWRTEISRPRTEQELMNETRVPLQVMEIGTASAQCCPICYDEFSVGSTAIKLPCGHFFDQDCIRKWLTVGTTCPMCRSPAFGQRSLDL